MLHSLLHKCELRATMTSCYQMKHYRVKPSVCCISLASRPETDAAGVVYAMHCIIATDLEYGTVTTRMCIIRYYIIATEHMYA